MHVIAEIFDGESFISLRELAVEPLKYSPITLNVFQSAFALNAIMIFRSQASETLFSFSIFFRSLSS